MKPFIQEFGVLGGEIKLTNILPKSPPTKEATPRLKSPSIISEMLPTTFTAAAATKTGIFKEDSPIAKSASLTAYMELAI